ncbi:MAG: LPS export ABC transporter ATP-binding protein, partial [Afipia sp.]
MVDLLRIFRRRGPARGRQGFARAQQDGLRQDITSLAARMGDIFRPAAGEKPLTTRESAPVRREAVAAAIPRDPPTLAPQEASAFTHDAPPIPRNLSRDVPREQPRESAPRSRPASNGAAPRAQHSGYLAIHGVEKSF